MKKDQLKKGVAIFRVSTTAQKLEGFSLDAQERSAMEYAERNSIQLDHTYKLDETASKYNKRKLFRKIRDEFTKSKTVHHILFDTFDRSNRNQRDWIELKEIIKSDDRKHLHFVRDNRTVHASTKPSEMAMYGFLSVVAESNIEHHIISVKEGIKERVLQRLPPYKVKFGYKNVFITNKRRTVEKDEATQPLLMEIFQMATMGGHSYDQIRKEINKKLNLAGIKPFRSKSSIEELLKDPFYYGQFYYDGKLYNGSYAPSISKREYDHIQKNMRDPSKSKAWKRDKLLNGMIKCGHCGLSVTAEYHNRKNKTNGQVRVHKLYQCGHFYGKCPEPYINEEKLLTEYENAITNIQVDDILFHKIKEYLLKAHEARVSHYQEKKPILQRKINELEGFRDHAYEDKLRGKISEDYFVKRDNDWTVELSSLREDLQALETTNEEIYQRGLVTFELANQARNLYKKQDNGEKVKFLKMVLSNASLRDGKLQFEYKKPFDMIMKINQSAIWWR